MRATLSSGIGSLLSVMASHVRSSTSSGADAPYHLNPASPLGSVQILVKSDNPKIATANQSASEADSNLPRSANFSSEIRLKTSNIGTRWNAKTTPILTSPGAVQSHNFTTLT